MCKQNPEVADQVALNRLLADDSVLIDVLSGSEVSKACLLDAVAASGLQFEEINRIDFRVRFYGPLNSN